MAAQGAKCTVANNATECGASLINVSGQIIQMELQKVETTVVVVEGAFNCSEFVNNDTTGEVLDIEHAAAAGNSSNSSSNSSSPCPNNSAGAAVNISPVQCGEITSDGTVVARRLGTTATGAAYIVVTVVTGVNEQPIGTAAAAAAAGDNNSSSSSSSSSTGSDTVTTAAYTAAMLAAVNAAVTTALVEAGVVADGDDAAATMVDFADATTTFQVEITFETVAGDYGSSDSGLNGTNSSADNGSGSGSGGTTFDFDTIVQEVLGALGTTTTAMSTSTSATSTFAPPPPPPRETIATATTTTTTTSQPIGNQDGSIGGSDGDGGDATTWMYVGSSLGSAAIVAVAIVVVVIVMRKRTDPASVISMKVAQAEMVPMGTSVPALTTTVTQKVHPGRSASATTSTTAAATTTGAVHPEIDTSTSSATTDADTVRGPAARSKAVVHAGTVEKVEF